MIIVYDSINIQVYYEDGWYVLYKHLKEFRLFSDVEAALESIDFDIKSIDYKKDGV